MTERDPIHDRIQSDIETNPVVLYMKGTPVFPQCGFSAQVVQVLSMVGVKFKAFDVLADDRLVLHERRLWLGMMPGSTKARDLQRDGRFANAAGEWTFWRAGNPYGVRSWREENAEATQLPIWRILYRRR